MSKHYPDWRINRKMRRLPPDIRQTQAAHSLLKPLYINSTGHIVAGFGHYFERTSLNDYLMIYCTEGEGWYRSGTMRLAVQAGQVLFVHQHTPHAYGAKNRNPWTIHWAHFSGTEVQAFLDLLQVSPEKPLLSIGVSRNVVGLFNAILAVLKTSYALPQLINAASYLRQILSNLVLLNAPEPDIPSEADKIAQIIDFMQENITESIRLEDLATRANMSVSHFSRVFHDETGFAPIDYFIRLKIQRACELLDSTTMRVNEVSQFLGYQDPYYFSRLFKKTTQYSPTAYRKACQQRGLNSDPVGNLLAGSNE